jgi:hypothetical protein
VGRAANQQFLDAAVEAGHVFRFARRDVRQHGGDSMRNKRGTPSARASWFKLAPSKSMPITKLVRPRDDDVGRLIVRLAAAYNDFKSVEMAVELLSQHGVPPSQDSRGEYSGVLVHCVRMSAGIMQNALEIIRQEARAVSSDEVGAAVRTLSSRSARAGWASLVSEARAADTATQNTGLRATRNKSAFHYDRQLLEACDRAFSAGGNGVGEPAYSDGPTMQETRFYFVDAALHRLAADHVGQSPEELQREVRDTCNRANLAIKPLLIALLDARRTAR